eukprot:g44143.t1
MVKSILRGEWKDMVVADKCWPDNTVKYWKELLSRKHKADDKPIRRILDTRGDLIHPCETEEVRKAIVASKGTATGVDRLLADEIAAANGRIWAAYFNIIIALEYVPKRLRAIDLVAHDTIFRAAAGFGAPAPLVALLRSGYDGAEALLGETTIRAAGGV